MKVTFHRVWSHTLSILLLIIFLVISFSGCASMRAVNDINTNPDNLMRGDPENTSRAIKYLNEVLENPEGREVRAYNRRAYSPETAKNLFLFHSFYVFLKDGKLEHTLVYTVTPKGSVRNGNWMLDALSDIDSYNLYLAGDNIWDVEEYTNRHGKTLDLVLTTEKILKRVKANFTFFGPSSVRDMPWYHLAWIALAPPPILSLSSVLLFSIHADNCTSAVVETMVWK